MTSEQNVQNIELDAKELELKYGDTKVGVIELTAERREMLGEGGFIPWDGMPDDIRMVQYWGDVLANDVQYMKRSEAELSQDYLQPIVYAMLMCFRGNDPWLFVTRRIGKEGDARLRGLYSVGIGGHMDEGETFDETMFREIKEEVGLGEADLFGYQSAGLIYDKSTAVGSVHLGIVLFVYPIGVDIHVVETDKLEGEWISLYDLKRMAKEGQLESWSAICTEVVNERFGGVSDNG